MTCATAWAQSPFGGGDGSPNNPYLINNETHWNNFCYALQQNNTWSQFGGKYYKLGADIGTSSNPVNTMAGSEGHEFCGTFDGNGKTIHISLNSTGNYTAIFRCVSNVGSNSATIKNLNVEGTVTANAGHKYVGGLVGGCWGVITIENCRVSTVINSFVVGDGTHGGIVGVQNSGTLTITGCVFDGSIASANTNNPTSCCGGFMGWNSTSVTITDCLLAADMSSISSDDSYTFVRRGGNNTLTINNCYYLNALGTTQGQIAYTRTNLPANIGSQSASYGNGNVIAYTNGFKYDGKYYVGSDSDLTVNDAGTEYTIDTATGWNYFCAVLAENAQGYFTGKTVKLGNNITVSTMAGDSDHKFSGTFDGNGKTLTFNCGSSSQRFTEEYCAPFRYADGATFKNLSVGGTIYTSAKYAAGIVSSANGTTAITNCRSSINTTSIDYVRGENVNRNLNQLCIEVHEADTLRDRAYVKTGEGSSCSKFIFNPATPKLFVPMGNKDYAFAYTGDAKVMPLNFIYQKHGTYTLTFDTEAIECDYLHLIDNATGIDIDLYQTPSYTFNSSDCNNATRFKIVFAEEATNDIAESFAYISNGNLVINNSGKATLQVMDITGRILSTCLYIVRLCNGNDAKTQKIVVE